MVRPDQAVGWPEARRRLSAWVTARLADAAGARVLSANSAKRIETSDPGTGARPGPVAGAVAFAGSGAISCAQAPLPPQPASDRPVRRREAPPGEPRLCCAVRARARCIHPAPGCWPRPRAGRGGGVRGAETVARPWLAAASRTTLRAGLDLLGADAPDRLW